MYMLLDLFVMHTMCDDLNVYNGAVKTIMKRKSWELFGAPLGF